ncbi:hypothetical protein LJB81_03895 [Desulfovibrio sp. OttesenSCG-928-M14]|nr:hypothetical protein [Desulfovibrio sp. OttesenSCG-928-M14]
MWYSPVYRLLWHTRGDMQGRFDVLQGQIDSLHATLHRQIVPSPDDLMVSFQRHKISALDSEVLRRYLYLCRYMHEGFAVLDVEPGLGFGAYFLREYNPLTSLCALDSVARYTELAASIHADTDILFQTGIPGDPALSLSRFDCIALLNVERNIAMSPQYMSTLAAHLFDGGLLALAFTNKALYRNHPQADAMPFAHEPADVRRMLEDSGFVLLEAQSQWPGQVEFCDGVDGPTCLYVARRA